MSFLYRVLITQGCAGTDLSRHTMVYPHGLYALPQPTLIHNRHKTSQWSDGRRLAAFATHFCHADLRSPWLGGGHQPTPNSKPSLGPEVNPIPSSKALPLQESVPNLNPLTLTLPLTLART